MVTPARHGPALATLLVALLAARSPAPAAQLTGPSLVIESPRHDAYVSGRLTLRASVTPFDTRVSRVTFYADGHLACVTDVPPFECSWDAGAGVVPHHVRAVASLASGDRLVDNVRTRGLDYAENVDVDMIHVTATVTDGRGRFVRGLTREDFLVTENDAPQPLSHFAAENIPLELIVAIDVSSSMAPAMPRLKQAVRAFLEALSPQDRVTLIAFNDNIFTLARREASLEARLRALDRIAAWGGTALYDAVLKALDLLERRTGRTAAVIFSDGEDQSSFATAATVEARAAASEATLYMIGQGRATRDSELKRVLRRLAHVSGGRAFYTSRIGQLAGAFARITDELSNQYLLAYPPPNPARDGAWRRIEVKLLSGDHTVRAREGYRPMPEEREP